MSYGLETLNRGTVEDCGFLFGDNETIRLGALPAMPIEQFVRYSSETILSILESENIDPKLKQKFIARISFECGRLFQSLISREPMKRENPDDALARQIIKGLSPRVAANFGNIARDYPNNPFKFGDGKVIISNFYEVDPEDFVFFASYIYGGGTFGWNPRISPPPEEVKHCILKLQGRLVEERGT